MRYKLARKTENYMEKILKIVRPVVITPFEAIRRIFSVHVMRHFHFLNYPHHSEHRGHDFENDRDFLFLPEIHSAKKHIHAENISFGIVFAVAAVALLALVQFVFQVSVLVVLSGLIVLLYVIFLGFKVWVVYAGRKHRFIEVSDRELAKLTDEELPMYTVFIPLLNEAEVVPQIMRAMTAIDYPKEKIEYIITLEAYDHETRKAIEDAKPPKNFRILTLPDVRPKSKPKALNVAFREAKGEFIVIYDAEIIPDRNQLRKAYVAFKKNPHLGAMQTRLDHYNASQNLLTKLFNAEFAFYYDLFLPGLERMGFPVPLSGHSTHFRAEILKTVGAWDPYNVTEDCDVGMRLHRQGYQTGILNSMSYEEATSSLGAWIPQRTRWMKGFIQTSVVHLRHPLRFKKEIGGWGNFAAFFCTIPGTIILNLLNFLSWITQLVWFFAHPEFIQRLYPPLLLYFAVASFVAGSFIFMYMNLIAVYRRGRYHLVKYVLLTPAYWVLLAIATLRAMVQFVSNPHAWEKTKHGSHLKQNVSVKTV